MSALRVSFLVLAYLPLGVAAQPVPAGFKLVGVIQGPVTIACQDPPPVDPAQSRFPCGGFALASGWRSGIPTGGAQPNPLQNHTAFLTRPAIGPHSPI